LRAALYLRVSTKRQAEKDLSIPDQRKQLEAFCKQRGWMVASEFVEPGASGTTDDRRPAFQAMLGSALGSERPFDVIIVHSFSRFFRDAYKFEYHRRKLDKAGVSLISITQEVGEDPMGEMVRQILNLFDEYQSKENAKHVLRAMNENARQGYWNGARPPFGYAAVAVETKGDAVKKKLVVNPEEAELVKETFRLFQHGTGKSGPMGVRRIVNHLNSSGVTYRRGHKFSSGLVHAMLTCTTYKGQHHFNRRSKKTGQVKDRAEWVPFETPAIIEPAVFDLVQAQLASRAPTVTPPREVNGPTLLTGLAKCSSGSGMTVRTGKGGRYKYYTCHRHMNQGACDCSRKSIPMPMLDGIVLDELESRILVPERIAAILTELIDRTRQANSDGKARVRDLNRQEREITAKLERLYDALSDGMVQKTETFQSKVAQLEKQRAEIIRLKSQMAGQSALPAKVLAQNNLEKFTKAVKANLRDEDPAFRRAYVRQFVDRVEVSYDEVRISGSKAALAGAIASQEKGTSEGVPSFVRKWWAVQGLNLRPHACEACALPLS
jgi:site-specific DNA recombinase